MRIRKIAVITNGSAGSMGAAKRIHEIRDAFEKLGNIPKISLVHGTEITSATQTALEEGYETIVAAGGDGTVHAVAESLIGTDAILGILPLGTLNHFAKDLGIPLSLPEAARVIAEEHDMRVDVGAVNGTIFINNSSIGVYPKIVRQREALQQTGNSKWIAFAKATFAILHRNPSLSVRVASGEHAETYRASFVFVGNNEYELDGLSAQRSVLDGNSLHVHIGSHVSRLRLAWIAFGLIRGKLKEIEEIMSFETQAVEIASPKPYEQVALDGEVRPMEMPLTYTIRPRTLRVLAPSRS